MTAITDIIVVGSAAAQAVGTLGALAIAILIDRNAGERLRKDRAEEWARQRKERDEAAQQVTNARVYAIVNARIALEGAAHNLRNLDMTSTVRARLSTVDKQNIISRAAALSFHMRQTAEVDPNLLAALTLAEQEMGNWRATALNDQSFTSPSDRDAFVTRLRNGGSELKGILDEYQRLEEQFELDNDRT